MDLAVEGVDRSDEAVEDGEVVLVLCPAALCARSP
jgi:hypothetical protein